MAKELKFTHPAKARALIAYIKSDGVLEAHKITNSYHFKVQGLSYLVLTSMSAVKAVYRKNNDNSLRRLTRYPKKINDLVPKHRLLTNEECVKRQGDFLVASFGVGTPDASGLMDEWLELVNEMQLPTEYGYELVGMTVEQIKDGQKAGFITSPPNIDSIREYRQRIALKDSTPADRKQKLKDFEDSIKAMEKDDE